MRSKIRIRRVSEVTPEWRAHRVLEGPGLGQNPGAHVNEVECTRESRQWKGRWVGQKTGVP